MKSLKDSGFQISLEGILFDGIKGDEKVGTELIFVMRVEKGLNVRVSK